MSADIEQPTDAADTDINGPAATGADAAPVAAEPETPEAERDVESDTLEIPDSSVEGGKAKYVPASALAGARKEMRELKQTLETAKAGSARAAQLEQQIAELQGQIGQILPMAQAYQAAVQQPRQPVAEDDTEARELAQSLDLYQADGTPDIGKARKVLAVMDRKAKQTADATVAPIHHRNVQQASAYNLQRAINTELPNGVRPDAAILRGLWARLDPSVTANEEQAKHLVIQALGMGSVQGKAAARGDDGKFVPAKPAAEIPPPLHVEKAGGRDTAPSLALNDQEKKVAKDLGLSEKEYLDRAKQAPWLR